MKNKAFYSLFLMFSFLSFKSSDAKPHSSVQCKEIIAKYMTNEDDEECFEIAEIFFAKSNDIVDCKTPSTSPAKSDSPATKE